MILFEPRPRPPKGSSFTTATSLIKLKRKESSNQSLGNRICPHLPLMYCLEKCTSLYQRRGGLDSDADANTGGRLCYIRTTILQIKNYDEFIRDSPTAPWAMRISSTRAFRKKRINRCSTSRRRKGNNDPPTFFFSVWMYAIIRSKSNALQHFLTRMTSAIALSKFPRTILGSIPPTQRQGFLDRMH